MITLYTNNFSQYFTVFSHNIVTQYSHPIFSRTQHSHAIFSWEYAQYPYAIFSCNILTMLSQYSHTIALQCPHNIFTISTLYPHYTILPRTIFPRATFSRAVFPHTISLTLYPLHYIPYTISLTLYPHTIPLTLCL
jgi:hypothetical protein